MGELTYDNLHWQAWMKDLGMASVRSLGWQLGTIREVGGAPIDLGKQVVNLLSGKEARITPKMGYTLGLPIVMGINGAIMAYLFTGKHPDDLKGYYFVKTGRKNSDGTDERVSLPSYMKDIFSYEIEPGKTIANKVHPLLSMMVQMWNNEDYYGTEIRNEGDPAMQQWADYMEYVGNQMMPFSVRNLQARRAAGGTWPEATESFFGITPAPRYVDRTPAETEMYNIARRRGGHETRTKDKAEESQFINQFIGRIHGGSATKEDLEQAKNLGVVDDYGYPSKTFDNALTHTPQQRVFSRLEPEDAVKVWNLMRSYEKKTYADVFAKKMATVKPDNTDLDPSDIIRYVREARGIADSAQKAAAPGSGLKDRYYKFRNAVGK